METLFRLADHFGTDRVQILIVAGYLKPGDQLERGRPQPVLSNAEGPDHRDYLIQELLDELAKIPDEWEPEVIAQARMLVRLSNNPPVRFIGDEDEDEDEDIVAETLLPIAEEQEEETQISTCGSVSTTPAYMETALTQIPTGLYTPSQLRGA